MSSEPRWTEEWTPDVAITCDTCGATLQFMDIGETLDCACGHKWRMTVLLVGDEPAEATAAAAQPSRKDIRAAVYNAGCKTDENFWTLWTDTPESSINMWLDAITDAVMAVLEPEQGGE